MEWPISDSEWLVMDVVWDRAPATAEDVIGALPRSLKWHPRTVKTLLHRLVKKGVLGYERTGNRYLYRPLVAREECIREASRSFVSRVFGGNAVPLLEYFVRDGGLSPREIEHLRRLLDEEGRDHG